MITMMFGRGLLRFGDEFDYAMIGECGDLANTECVAVNSKIAKEQLDIKKIRMSDLTPNKR
jgi:hypothetical protein